MDRLSKGSLNPAEPHLQERPDNTELDSFQECEPGPYTPRFLTPRTSHVEDPIPAGEFPNYFHTNDPVKAARIQEKVNEAMTSILKRLEIPYIDPETNKLRDRK